jgi:hypothetical protein
MHSLAEVREQSTGTKALDQSSRRIPTGEDSDDAEEVASIDERDDCITSGGAGYLSFQPTT